MDTHRDILHTRLLDTRFAVAAPTALLRRLGPLLPAADARPGPVVHVAVHGSSVSVDGGPPRRAAHGTALPGEVVAALNAAAVAGCLDLAVHAGVVARQGRAVAFPAVSGAGKSTLTAACLQAGLAYVSDEALVLDADARVRPYPKPLSLEAGAVALLGLPRDGDAERLLGPAELGARTAAGTTSLAHVLLLDRRPGPAVVEALPRAEGVALLLRMAFNHHVDRARALTRASAAGAQAWRLSFDRPGEGAAAVAELLAS